MLLSARLNLAGLDRHILDFAVARGRTVKEETWTVFKGIVRDLFKYNPPAGNGNTGPRAKRVGELAIIRDLGRMGFQPVQIKGFRIITKAWGRPITPVRVATKLNPKFFDPEAHHRARLSSKHGGRVTRGGKQAFYVSSSRLKMLSTRLFREVGKLASGWVPAALQLGVPVPAFIKRHAGSGRGSQVQIVETKTRYVMRVVNHFPATAAKLGAEMQRLIDGFLVPNAIRRLQRQLKAKARGDWSKTKR